jgi:hypothetical protein
MRLSLLKLRKIDVIAVLEYDAAYYCRKDTTFRDILSILLSGLMIQA